MSDTDAGSGKVVVNRAMSLDGFIAGPDDAMDWIIEYTKDDPFPEVMLATGAMLVGRRTYEVSRRMSAENTTYDGGRLFVLTHRPPDEPEQGITFLTCDLAEAVATARAAADGKNLEILGADLASQCLRRGLVDLRELDSILSYAYRNDPALLAGWKLDHPIILVNVSAKQKSWPELLTETVSV